MSRHLIMVRDAETGERAYPVLAPEGMSIADSAPLVEQAIAAIDWEETEHPYGDLETALTPLGFEFPAFYTAEGRI
jgi:hypothetical protein